MTFFLVFLVSFLLTAALVSMAPRLGWIDRREGLEYRKPIEENIPVVGGAAILGAMGVAQYLDASILLPWPALIAAFVLGLVDDIRRGGLSPAVKLSGQIFVATLLIVVPGSGFADHSPNEMLLMGGLALIAMNAVNLFDHADGMAGTACCLALGPGAPALAAAVGGYLPFNIAIRKQKTFRETVPMTMLGDAGTHVLGVAVAATPGARWLLLVPVLDAVRVIVARTMRGVPFWEGDRTHLGNRLAGLGFGPISTSLVVVVLVAPPLVAQFVSGAADMGLNWLSVSFVLYLVAVKATHGHVAPALQTREAGNRTAQAIAAGAAPGAKKLEGLIQSPEGPAVEPEAPGLLAKQREAKIIPAPRTAAPVAAVAEPLPEVKEEQPPAQSPPEIQDTAEADIDLVPRPRVLRPEVLRPEAPRPEAPTPEGPVDGRDKHDHPLTGRRSAMGPE